jgi:16S rRNA (adenine1518-N6/adenine1519-N6)-dimethyltransferase
LLPSINYDSPGELRAFLDKHGIGMRKKFGQNFLVNPNARSRLLDALELHPGNEVWEIGAGLGAMTKGLLERGGRVTAFEIDPAFAGALLEFFGTQSNPDAAFSLIRGDVLLTWESVNPQGEDIFMFGNLPYNIAAALLADFIEKGRFFKRMVVTVQREVALRMAAKPGSKDYSSFSVLCASVYNVKLLQIIKSSSFYPSPRVDSQGVRLDLLSEKENKPRYFYPLVRSLFSSRRKTIRNTLSSFAVSDIIKKNLNAGEALLPVPEKPASILIKEAVEEVFHRSCISGDRRPETLSVDEFTALAAVLEDVTSNGK